MDSLPPQQPQLVPLDYVTPQKATLPPWRRLVLIGLACFVVGLAVFEFGSLSTAATDTEKVLWSVGAVGLGSGVALVFIAGMRLIFLRIPNERRK